ncbi:MAG: hypothetical protein KatS3mg050_1100 [Litorilinea sp.]|nr:MAG: hypothetical protein KatS3mg050_1100 [Litorilinea sp.]
MKTKAKQIHILLILVALLVGDLAQQPAQAATGTSIAVNTFRDEINDNAQCSLREAILAANTNTPIGGCPAGHPTLADTIELSPGTYTLTISGADEDDAHTGDLDIRGTLNLVVQDAGQATIQGAEGWNDRIFHILSGRVTLSHVIIQHGHREDFNSSDPSADDGGGILNEGVLTLNDAIVVNNAARNGGGLYNHGRLVLNRSIIKDNQTTSNTGGTGGGGIFNEGTLVLNDSQVSTNSARTSGGGIYNLSGTVTLNASAVISNTAITFSGGGLVNEVGAGAMVLNHSLVSGNSSRFDGAGIFNRATLKLSHSTVTENQTQLIGVDSGGGGIFNSGTCTLDTSTLSQNHAVFGGGLYNSGQCTILESAIRDNEAVFGGGGIENYIEKSLTVERSTISNNTAGGNGGGIDNFFGHSSLFNSTVSGNRAGLNGGGIHNNGVVLANQQLVTSTTTLSFVTITDNTADADEDEHGDGGGIFNVAHSLGNQGVVRLHQAILAGNHDRSAADKHPDCSGPIDSLGFNLVGNDTGCSGFSGLFTMPGDIVGTGSSPIDPKLGPLQDNGGPTLTHALLAGSPAIENGNNTTCPASDQRGFPRPTNAFEDSLARARCDIGSFEISRRVSLGGVGTSELTPIAGTTLPDVRLTFTLTWTHPVQWRKLDVLDLQVGEGLETVLWVRFTESQDDSGNDASTFSLIDGHGNVIGSGSAGEDTVLETETARLHLEESFFQAAGVQDPTVIVHFTVSFKQLAAGHHYPVFLSATDDDGNSQEAEMAGMWGVGSFVYLPWTSQP